MFGFGKKKPQIKVEVIDGGKLPKEIADALKEVIPEIAKKVAGMRPDISEAEAKEIYQKPAKFAIEWDGKGGTHCEIDAHPIMFRKMLIEFIKGNLSAMVVLEEVVEYINHALECDCENCTAVTDAMKASIEKEEKKSQKKPKSTVKKSK